METTSEIIYLIINIICILSMVIVFSFSTGMALHGDWDYIKRNKREGKIYYISLVILFFACMTYSLNFISLLDYRGQEKNKNLPKYEQITYPIYKKIN